MCDLFSRSWHLLFAIFGIVIIPELSHAESFQIQIFVENQLLDKKNTNNIFAVERYLNQANIDQIYPQYSGQEPLQVLVNYGKFNIDYQFEDQLGAKLRLRIPTIQFDQTFEGGNRNESTRMALDYLKERGYLKKLQSSVVNETAKKSGNQIAGSAFSLLANSVRNDFVQYQRNGSGFPQDSAKGFIEVNYARDNMRDRSAIQRGVSLGYHYYSDQLKTQFGVNLPLLLTEIGSQESYTAILSGFAKHFLTERWQVGVGISNAITYTPNSEASGRYQGINFFQSYEWEVGASKWGWSMLLGDYQTIGFRGYDPKLSHFVNQQRVNFSQPIDWMNQPLWLKVYAGQVNFNGEDIQRDRVRELGVSLSGVGGFPWAVSLASEWSESNAVFLSLGLGF